MSLLPQTVSAKDIQRNYRKIFDQAKKTGEPIVVLNNNKPDVVIMSIKVMEKMIKKIELADAMEAIKSLEDAKKAGTLIKLNSLNDLIDK